MKAITLWEPWATLVAYGYKTYETRSWITHYRGPLLIHAAKRIPKRRELTSSPIQKALAEIGIKLVGDFPFGFGLAVVNLTGVERTEAVKGQLDEAQLAFGDYGPTRFAWRLKCPQRLALPIPLRGQQGIWNVPEASLVNFADE